jgi:predicted O-linked N-acetylglucosamine transferase (SPINDLY family)
MNSILIPHNDNENTSKFERNNNKIKIGFVSSYFRQHSVCNLKQTFLLKLYFKSFFFTHYAIF